MTRPEIIAALHALQLELASLLRAAADAGIEVQVRSWRIEGAGHARGEVPGQLVVVIETG